MSVEYFHPAVPELLLSLSRTAPFDFKVQVLPNRIGVSLEFIDFSKRILTFNSQLERRTISRRKILQLWKLGRIDRIEGKRKGFTIDRQIRISLAPSALVPVADIEPS